MDVVQIVWGVLYGYLFFWAIYLLFFAMAGLFYRSPAPSEMRLQRNFAVLIPAYQEDAIILSTVKANLKINFPTSRYTIFVIADRLKVKTVRELERLPIELVHVHFETSTKAKAINAALPLIDSKIFSHVVVLDADNIMAVDFLECVDQCIKDGDEETVLQAHRMAKNTNSTLALLDAINEEIGNHIFRKGHVSVGLSSALIGSGMVVSTGLYKCLMAKLSYVAIEDKMLEFALLKEGLRVSYVDRAFVYDEKVERSDQFSGQRSRWVANRFYFLKSEFKNSFKQLFVFNFDYFDKWLQALIPQKIILISYVVLFTIVSFFLSYQVVLSYILIGSLCLAFVLSIPRAYYTLRLLNALAQIPFLALSMVRILLRIHRVDPSKFNVTVKEVNT